MTMRSVLSAVLVASTVFIMSGCASTTSPTTNGAGNPTGTLYFTVTDIALGGLLARLDLATGVMTTITRAEAPNALPNKNILAVVPVAANGDLAIISADGSQEQVIVHEAYTPDFARAFKDPQLSRDGKYIAYSNLGPGGVYYVYVVDMSGNLVVTIGNGSTQQFVRPVWGANGELYMEGDANTTPGIYKVDAAFTTITPVNGSLNHPSQPSISPNGSKIAFIVGQHLWTMNADGAGAAQLTTSSGTEAYPVWSPDGNWIAVYNRANDILLIPVAGGTAISLGNKWSPSIFQSTPPSSSSQMDWK